MNITSMTFRTLRGYSCSRKYVQHYFLVNYDFPFSLFFFLLFFFTVCSFQAKSRMRTLESRNSRKCGEETIVRKFRALFVRNAAAALCGQPRTVKAVNRSATVLNIIKAFHIYGPSSTAATTNLSWNRIMDRIILVVIIVGTWNVTLNLFVILSPMFRHLRSKGCQRYSL